MTVNPEEGTVESVAMHILNKANPAPEEAEIVEEHEDANLEDEVEEEMESDEEIEESEFEEDHEDEEEEPTFTLKINGEEVEVTLDELQSGYMKDADYRQKTEAVASEKKAIAEERERLKNFISTEQRIVEEYEILSELNNKPLYTEDQLEKILDEQGEKAYLKAKSAQDRHSKNQKAIRDQLQTHKTQLTEAQKIQQQEVIKQEQASLYEKLPELKDEGNVNKLVSYLTGLGFSQELIENTVDHRLFILAEESRRYREIVNADKKPKKTAPKVIKRKARKDNSTLRDKQLQDLKKRAASTGNVKDIAKLIEARSS